MRFRAQTAHESLSRILAFGIVVIVGLARVLWRPHFPPELRAPGVILYLVAILLLGYSFFAGFWEMDAEGLRQCRLPWFRTRINWQDVTRIESRPLAAHLRVRIKIEYNRHGIGPKIGRIWPIYADRERFLEFLTSLRRFAPHAEFIDKTNKKFLPA